MPRAAAGAVVAPNSFLGHARGKPARSQPQSWRPAARPQLRPAAASSSDPFAGAAGAFNQTAGDLRLKFQKWAQQQKIDERLNSGLEAASKAARQAAEEAQRRAREVDEEYDVSGKAAEAARNVNEAAAGFESRYNLRSRISIFFKDARRRLPLVLRQLREFFNTPLGAVTFLFLFMLSVFTGAFWVILRFVFMLFWLMLLLSPMLINYMNARAMAEQQERYREYVREQQRRQSNPFYGTPLEDLFAGAAGSGQQRPGAEGPRRGGWGSMRSSMRSQDAIDVEYQSLDD